VNVADPDQQRARERKDSPAARAQFRDPAGSSSLTESHAVRRIAPNAVEPTLAFLASPFRTNLERSGDLIATEIVTAVGDSSELPGDLVLRHPRIDPISYPWEWTPAQWCAAAEFTLRMAGRANDAGWTLKDATPLNILFQESRPVLVDVLSFERRDPASSTWLAYAQFVRTFLLPLVAAKYLHWPLQATLLWRDGYEPATLYRALQPWQRLYPDLIDVITMATLFEGFGKKPAKPRDPPADPDPELIMHILHRRLARLGRQIRNAGSFDRSSRWSSNEKPAAHQNPTDTEAKQGFVRAVLNRCHPAQILDIGAHTGAYSLLAAHAGVRVTAIDGDAEALGVLWREADRQKLPVTTIVANIARPTPATGWRNREQLSLLDRLHQKFDVVLMLAVIHRLILREQVSLAGIAELCVGLTRHWLVVEWVPPSDPSYQESLSDRDDLYGRLSEEDLKQAFDPYFHVADRKPLENQRILLLLERNHPAEQSGSTS
jgi:SAM-dependent methyltransferase